MFLTVSVYPSPFLIKIKTNCTLLTITIFLLLKVPAAGFTQRATIDPDLNEIHVLSVSIVYLIQFLLQYFFCELALQNQVSIGFH